MNIRKKIIKAYIYLKRRFGGFNMGHLGGYDCGDEFSPENSLKCLTLALLRRMQENKLYKFTEFDVCETLDNVIVVFHDAHHKTIERMCPATPPEIRDKRICDLPWKIIRELILKGSVSTIPSLETFLFVLSGELKKPVRVEIKNLHSTKGRKSLLDQVLKFKEDNKPYDVHLAIRKSRFENIYEHEYERDVFKNIVKNYGLELKVL